MLVSFPACRKSVFVEKKVDHSLIDQVLLSDVPLPLYDTLKPMLITDTEDFSIEYSTRLSWDSLQEFYSFEMERSGWDYASLDVNANIMIFKKPQRYCVIVVVAKDDASIIVRVYNTSRYNQ